MTALNKQALLSTDKHANQHMLSRLIVEANSAELRALAESVEQYTDRLIAALEAAERLITEWEQRELSNKRQLVINGLCESGEPFWEIDDYMKKWDAEHPREAAAAGIGVKGE